MSREVRRGPFRKLLAAQRDVVVHPGGKPGQDLPHIGGQAVVGPGRQIVGHAAREVPLGGVTPHGQAPAAIGPQNQLWYTLPVILHHDPSQPKGHGTEVLP